MKPPPQPLPRRTYLDRIVTLLTFAFLAAALLYLDTFRIAIYAARTDPGEAAASTNGVGLGGYVTEIEAKPIAGLNKNASGLTYNPLTGTLFVVINQPPSVAEISPDGELLRQFPLPATRDPEGITHVEGDLFALADEIDNRLHWIRITPGKNGIEELETNTLEQDFVLRKNLGFEGLSWDESRHELLVVNEKRPRRVFILSGIAPGSPNPEPQMQDWQPRLWLGFLGRDLASLTVHSPSGNLLTLSEESALISEYARSGEVRGVMPLWRGWHGLRETIPQAEGLALGPDGALYLISEPNLFYRFAKKAATAVPGKGSAPGQAAANRPASDKTE